MQHRKSGGVIQLHQSASVPCSFYGIGPHQPVGHCVLATADSGQVASDADETVNRPFFLVQFHPRLDIFPEVLGIQHRYAAFLEPRADRARKLRVHVQAAVPVAAHGKSIRRRDQPLSGKAQGHVGECQLRLVRPVGGRADRRDIDDPHIHCGACAEHRKVQGGKGTRKARADSISRADPGLMQHLYEQCRHIRIRCSALCLKSAACRGDKSIRLTDHTCPAYVVFTDPEPFLQLVRPDPVHAVLHPGSCIEFYVPILGRNDGSEQDPCTQRKDEDHHRPEQPWCSDLFYDRRTPILLHDRRPPIKADIPRQAPKELLPRSLR